MELTKLINSVHAIQVSGEVERKDINGIFYDSRKVKSGSLFVALSGYRTDGHRFVLDAINSGASAVIIDNDSVIPDEIFIHRNVTKILVRNARIALAEVSKAFNKNAVDALTLVGITGTKGKTTTAWLVKHILESAGMKSGLLGTIANYIGQKKLSTSLTTPESCELHELFAEMLKEGCSHAVMEVSSHALALNRVHGLHFAEAIYTNLSLDHLDFHETFENYLDAKKILFTSLSGDATAIVNLDDERSEAILAAANVKKLTYGQNSNADLRISDISLGLDKTTFALHFAGNEYHIESKMFGVFNTYNIAAAFAAAYCNGIAPEEIVKAIATAPQVPGRFEVISAGKKQVIIDYAHTPDSLQKTLENIRLIVKHERTLVTVFGCGGNRDTTKRPIMGTIATEISDSVFVTSDNPRREDANAIIEDIVKGITKNNFVVVADREEAIRKAIQDTPEDAVILVAGKGHEDYQIIGDTKYPFSDAAIAHNVMGIA
jgi:UDP-N-acetylmuramoyl-L-alanyl-D-glutamate--2,6-diaminopimelate ligase